MEEIKQKWFLPKYNLSITDDNKVLTECGVECIEEVHQGQLKFRLPKTSIRISKKYIRKNCILNAKTIQQYCPF